MPFQIFWNISVVVVTNIRYVHCLCQTVFSWLLFEILIDWRRDQKDNCAEEKWNCWRTQNWSRTSWIKIICSAFLFWNVPMIRHVRESLDLEIPRDSELPNPIHFLALTGENTRENTQKTGYLCLQETFLAVYSIAHFVPPSYHCFSLMVITMPVEVGRG